MRHFYVLASGVLSVAPEAGSPAHREGQPLDEIVEGEGFGEMSLLRGNHTHTKTLTCASASGCEVVSILGSDFLRLVEKSSVVRESFERLHQKRQRHNDDLQAVLRTQSEERNDPVLKK